VNEEGVNTLRLALMSCLDEGRTNVVLNVAGVAFVDACVRSSARNAAGVKLAL
jgi:hypothetical protein